MAGSFVILFVEGETEKEFYDALISYYKSKSKTKIIGCRTYNIKGIGRFESKVTSKLKFEIIPKHPNVSLKVICCYDSDVFELAQKPPVNWSLVKKKVNELGITEFEEIVAVRMIEDWFLKDIEGICKYLKVPVPKKLEGKNGYEKMKVLFKKGAKPKIYQKGSNSHKFVPSLDLKTIGESVKKELKVLEVALGVSL